MAHSIKCLVQHGREGLVKQAVYIMASRKQKKKDYRKGLQQDVAHMDMLPVIDFFQIDHTSYLPIMKSSFYESTK